MIELVGTEALTNKQCLAVIKAIRACLISYEKAEDFSNRDNFADLTPKEARSLEAALVKIEFRKPEGKI